jgi:starch synthase (maltosyl-transferring)
MIDETGEFNRVTIEGVTPEIDGGRYPAKRVVGDRVMVGADIYADGHDRLAAVLLHRREADREWKEVPFEPLGNDRWKASFPVSTLGRYVFTIRAWVDEFESWREGFSKKVEADQDVAIDILVGAGLVKDAARRAPAADAKRLQDSAARLSDQATSITKRSALALENDLAELVRRYPDRDRAVSYPKELTVEVDPEGARFSTWYEMFPRSCAESPGKHGTFKDCESRLPYLAEMGFDILYLPPIHPIGTTLRKGKNNSTVCRPDDPGSPWAIGAAEGGHKAVHPALGTLKDFRALVSKASEYGIQTALDIAFQCSPDHPYVKEHPEWFRHRPDGTIQYAENPPKKYEDIYPFDFETKDRQGLWEELESIFRFWIEQGVLIFRVDNPHTKPFRFWEWLIGRIKKDHPEAIFFAEAFTRPKVMYQLAKLGFSQSYTYFAWRNTQWELIDYFTELTRTEVFDFFRPNLWPNTPDILTEYLQTGGRPAFMIRLLLAATLGSSYGIYGPAFELMESQPREPGSEEYMNSEKYEIRQWDIDRPDSLRELIGRINRIRKYNPALQQNGTLCFHTVDNQQILCFSKASLDGTNVIVTVVNLDPFHTHSGWLDLALQPLGVGGDETFQVHDLLSDARYLWRGSHNFVELNPHVVPAHVFRLRRRFRTEKDFDYYM